MVLTIPSASVASWVLLSSVLPATSPALDAAYSDLGWNFTLTLFTQWRSLVGVGKPAGTHEQPGSDPLAGSQLRPAAAAARLQGAAQRAPQAALFAAPAPGLAAAPRLRPRTRGPGGQHPAWQLHLTFALEHVAQVAAAVGARDLHAPHAHGVVHMPLHGAGQVVVVGWPPAATVELGFAPASAGQGGVRGRAGRCAAAAA